MESADNTCLVCHEHIQTFAIGQCDHPICFKCSTRMRALCNQFYCPICRTDLPEVFFMKKKEKFGEMPVRQFVTNKKLKIQFEDEDVQKEFDQLLEHRCKICKDRLPEKNFKCLRDHIRRAHTMFFCDLCLDLKIFTSERKVYNRQELAQHRRIGDKDDRSYKGHPLCQFCEQRYLDKDELYKHLRKDHFFCHFCESQGSQEFYDDYINLREHFVTEHFLCEEGDCATAQFTNAFRSDIDLKGHQASQHSKAQTKQQARQERTINIDINFTPRPNSRLGRGGREDYVDDRQKRVTRHQGARGGRGNRYSKMDSHREKEDLDRAIQASLITMQNEDMKKVQLEGKLDSSSSEDEFTHTEDNFPALGANQPILSSAMAASVSSVMTNSKPSLADRFAMSNNMSVQHGKLSDFPTLTSSSVRSDSPKIIEPFKIMSYKNNTAVVAKTLEDDFPLLKSDLKEVTFSKATWTRPKMAEDNKKTNQDCRKVGHLTPSSYSESDFPILGQPSKTDQNKKWFRSSEQAKVQKRPGDQQISVHGDNLVDRVNQVDVPKLEKNTFKKTKNKHKVCEIKCEDEGTGLKAKSSLDDIAELLMSNCETENASAKTEGCNINEDTKMPLEEKDLNSKKQVSQKKDQKIKETKNTEKIKKANKETTSELSVSKKKEDKIEKKMVNLVKDIKTEQEIASDKKKLQQEGRPSSDKQFDFSSKEPLKFVVVEEEFPALTPSVPLKKPPPGFPQAREHVSAKAPPGFANIESAHKLPPGFSPNLVEVNNFDSNGIAQRNLISMPSDLDSLKYLQPEDFQERNHMLADKIQSVFSEDPTHFVSFRTLSREFRSGEIEAAEYYNRCQDLLGRMNFENIFSELVALLPDIKKQQELLLEDRLSKGRKKSNSGKGAWKQSQLDILTCPTCQQVLVRKDYDSHVSSHSLNSDFPLLSGLGNFISKEGGR